VYWNSGQNIVIVVCIALVVRADNLIVNGGFEDNTCTDPNWCDYGGGEFCTGWFNDGTVDLQPADPNQMFPYEGNFCLDLSGNGLGDIHQSVTLQAGNSYVLSWEQSGNFNCGPGVKNMYVVVNYDSGDQNDPQYYSFDTTGIDAYNMNWQATSYSFTALDNAASVWFVSQTDTCGGIVLDAISLVDVTPVTPQTLCASVDPSDWTYGQGYYCFNGGVGFVECWGASPALQSQYQDCAAGTSCSCSSGVECSDEGTQSPCR